MKLKKIASLALAGLMAVGMLAGCSSNGGNDDNKGDKTVATTGNLTSSFVSELNKKIEEKEKDDRITLTAGDSSTLSTQLKTFVEKNSSDGAIAYVRQYGIPTATLDDFGKYISAGTNVSQLMSGSIVEGKANKAVKLYAYDASVSDDAIVDDLMDKLATNITNQKAKMNLAVEQGTAEFKCSYTVSAVYVEDSYSNSGVFNNGIAVKYVAVLVTGVANK